MQLNLFKKYYSFLWAAGSAKPDPAEGKQPLKKLRVTVEIKVIALATAIQEGFDSGLAKNFVPQNIWLNLNPQEEKMADYIFTNKAIEHFSGIWDYTFDFLVRIAGRHLL